ncbi:MAG: mechanosensitive ion channel family protein [Muribaculaceae bacterium]|nr:mechanosensitive ion channel family protein [Muribaculaceae bacterium]
MHYNIIICLLLLISSISTSTTVNAQILKKAGELFLPSQSTHHSDSSSNGGADFYQHEAKSDSLQVQELKLQIEQMKLNEILLKSKLEETNQHQLADSLKKAVKLQRIDSLRAVTPGVPIVVEEDTLFKIYAARGGHSALDRAETTTETIIKIGKDRRLHRDSVYLLDNETYIDIMYGDKVIISVTENDALWHATTPMILAETWMPIIADKISLLKAENSFWQILKRAALFVLVIIVQYMILKLINFLFRKLRREIIWLKVHKLKPLVIRDYELLNTKYLCRALIVLCRFLRYVVLIFFFIITVPILFSIFPQTESLAYKIFYYIIDPVKMVVKAIIEYIPNIFIIAIIWYCVRYIVKGLKYITEEIKSEKLKISGFYSDWAEPTFNIIRFLLYAFMIAMIYPYLPGSESGVFQGISVFVGLIVSLGSSSVISNFIAGFVITYMRPFKAGDFIKVNDTMGNVVEKSPFITRIRTIKNEIVTIPNSFITTSDTVNYSASARQYGLIIHTMFTMGYDVPWRTVHSLLIEAALKTNGILEHPAPFVLETEMNDNYMCYQINAYIKEADDMPVIMSDMLQNIQDAFNEAGIELFAPHHFTTKSKCDVAPVKVEISALGK